MPRKCCVPGCNFTIFKYHRLPVFEEEVYNVWLDRIADPKLKTLDPQSVYGGYRICTGHFMDINRCGSKRLKAYSVPTISVPGFTGEMSVENAFFYPSYLKITKQLSSTSDAEVISVDHCYSFDSTNMSEIVETSVLTTVCAVSNNAENVLKYPGPTVKVATRMGSYFAARLEFYNARKNSCETVAEWSARVKNLASKCGFTTELETVMKDVFVIGMVPNKLRDRLLEEDATTVTFEEVQQIALATESALREHDILAGSNQVQ